MYKFAFVEESTQRGVSLSRETAEHVFSLSSGYKLEGRIIKMLFKNVTNFTIQQMQHFSCYCSPTNS